MNQTTTRPSPAAVSKNPRPPIALHPVKSGKIAAVGYDAGSKTLAVTFNNGPGHIYHYPNVAEHLHQAFVGAESIGKFFGQHIQALPFEKFAPAPKEEPTASRATSAA